MRLARDEHPDLVITDILMPHMDGHELTTRMRADPDLAGTPVIFYTATYRVNEARILARGCGVKWVLSKPSDPETILQTTQEALGLPEMPAVDIPPPRSEQDTISTIDERLIDYLAELEMTHRLMSRVVEHGRSLASERGIMRQSSQRLSDTITSLQAVTLRLTALLELGLTLASERDPARLLQTLCQAARNICVAKYAALGVANDHGEGLRYFFAHGLEGGAEASPAWPPPRSSLLARLIEQGTPRRLSDLDGDPKTLGLPATHPPVHSLLWVPIVSRERTYGWFYLADKLGAAEFGESDEQMARTVASQLAVAYENLLLYEEVRRVLRGRTIMSECNRALAHATEEAGLLDAMCRIVVNVGGYRMAWIGVGEPDGNPVVRLAARAGSETSCADGWALGGIIAADAACPAIQAIRDGLPHVVPDILTDPVCACERECKWACGSRSVIALPLQRAGKPFGALTIYEAEPGAFEAEQIAVLQELADDVAYGITSRQGRAAHRQAEQALRQSEARLREAQEIGRMGHWELDPGSGTIAWSAQVYRLFDRDPSLAPPSFEEYLTSYVPDEAARVRQLLHEILDTGERMEVDLSARLPGGRSAHHHLSVLPEKDVAGRVVRLRGTVQDISELKRTEASLRRVNRTLRLLSQCNQMLVHTDEVQDLLDGVCRAIVESGGHRMAWVGMTEHDDRRRVHVAAIAGDDQGFLDRLVVTWDDSASGHGPTGTAIRERRIILIRRSDTDPDLAPWRDMVRECGIKSALSLPLKTSEGVLGALAIYAAEEEDVFDTDEVKLLSELADDLAYGIEVLQTRAARRRTEGRCTSPGSPSTMQPGRSSGMARMPGSTTPMNPPAGCSVTRPRRCSLWRCRISTRASPPTSGSDNGPT